MNMFSIGGPEYVFHHHICMVLINRPMYLMVDVCNQGIHIFQVLSSSCFTYSLNCTLEIQVILSGGQRW